MCGKSPLTIANRYDFYTEDRLMRYGVGKGGIKWRFPDSVLLLACKSTTYCDIKKCSFAS